MLSKIRGLKISPKIVMLFVFVMVTAFMAVPAFAQSDTITIDTSSLFTQINTWIAALDDVVFLGAAIGIAIAVLTYIGYTILRAFNMRGSR